MSSISFGDSVAFGVDSTRFENFLTSFVEYQRPQSIARDATWVQRSS